MHYKGAKRGWYTVLNPEKFIIQTKESKSVMNSTRINEGKLEVEYKSSLELKSLKYCDYNKHIINYSLEPFPIKYHSPVDNKIHRYFVDLYIVFSTGDKFLVEIKSFSETKEPKVPERKTQKAIMNYQKAIQTFVVNTAKWNAATKFCKEHSMRFIILTEKELK